MEKKCSIRFLLLGIALSAAISLGAGFLAGSQKSWETYEARIALLKQQNEALLSQQEASREEGLAESMNALEPYAYVLLEENGYVAVYHADRETLFSTTDILMESLPGDLQEEIRGGKPIMTEAELYNFLENYTS